MSDSACALTNSRDCMSYCRCSLQVFLPSQQRLNQNSSHLHICVAACVYGVAYCFHQRQELTTTSLTDLLQQHKDTVPSWKEDFVANHFSHNAPHRP